MQVSAVDGEVCPERVEFGTEAARSGPWSRRGAGGLTCGWVLWDNQVGFFGPGVGEMVFVPTIPVYRLEGPGIDQTRKMTLVK